VDNDELEKAGWEHLKGKKCLLCKKEKLYYKHFGVGKPHYLYCKACKASIVARTEEDVKRQAINE